MSATDDDPKAGAAPRVRPVEPGTRPELAATEARILAERGRLSTLYRVLLNSEPIAAGWEQMLTAVRNRAALAPDLREIAILRVAVLNRAEYEFDAHVPHAQAAGVSAAAIAALRLAAPGAADDGEAGDAAAAPRDPLQALAPRERAVVALTDAMTRDIVVPDRLVARVLADFAPDDPAADRHLVELVATIAAYNMVSRFLVALRISH